MSDENLVEAKAILIGEVAVGKTSLINVSIGMKFNSSQKTTISSNFVKKKIEINSQKYIIYLWDTAGQEKLKAMTKLFFKGADIVIFVYDITSKKSFENLKDWIKEVEDNLDNQHVCGIAGNKKDLFLQEEVNEELGRKYANSLGMKFKLTSAKDDPKSFNDLLEELIKEAKPFLIPKNKISLKDGKNKDKNGCNC